VTPAQVSKAIKKRPFIPYVIAMKGGDKFRIGHPESIWQAKPPQQTTIIIQDQDAGVVCTDTSCIDSIVFPVPKKAK
jgi:hypothetical protein